MTSNVVFKVTIFCTSNDSKMMQYIVTILADRYKVVYDSSNSEVDQKSYISIAAFNNVSND